MDLKDLAKNSAKSKPSANKAGARQDAGPNSNEDFDSPYAGGLFGAGQVLSIDDFNKFASGNDSQGAYDNAATATVARKQDKISKRQPSSDPLNEDIPFGNESSPWDNANASNADLAPWENSTPNYNDAAPWDSNANDNADIPWDNYVPLDDAAAMDHAHSSIAHHDSAAMHNAANGQKTANAAHAAVSAASVARADSSAAAAAAAAAAAGSAQSALVNGDDVAPWDSAVPNAFAQDVSGTSKGSGRSLGGAKASSSSKVSASGTKKAASIKEALHDPALLHAKFNDDFAQKRSEAVMETASDLINTINNFSQNLNSSAESEAEDAVREISGASLKHGDVRVAGDDNSTEMFDPENNTYVGSKPGKKSRSQQEIEAMSDDDFLSALAFGGSDIFDDADDQDSDAATVASHTASLTAAASSPSASSLAKSTAAKGSTAQATANATATGTAQATAKITAKASAAAKSSDKDSTAASTGAKASSTNENASSKDESTKSASKVKTKDDALHDQAFNALFGGDADNQATANEPSAEDVDLARSIIAGTHILSPVVDKEIIRRGDVNEIVQAASDYLFGHADKAKVANDAIVIDAVDEERRVVTERDYSEDEPLVAVEPGDYDDSFSELDRKKKSLEILNHSSIIVSNRSYNEYVLKMKEARMKPFSRESVLKMNVARVFAANGILGKKLEGYSPRKGQQSFAASVAEVISTHQFLAVEAGTGTGKTFAYLVPPLLAGKTVMVSTRTKTLQDQLSSKDVPKIFNILGTTHLNSIALKGHANYICRYVFDGDGMRSLNARDRQTISAYIDKCTDSLDSDPKNALFGEMIFSLKEGARSLVTCDSFLCQEMASNCPYAARKRDLLRELSENSNTAASVVPVDQADMEIGRAFGPGAAGKDPAIGFKRVRSGNTGIDGSHCFVFAARQEAKERDVVVINHALFYAALQSPNGIGNPNSILPLPDVLIFDEAHTLAEVGREFFKRDVSLEFLKDLVDEVHKCFSSTKVSTKTGAFAKTLYKIECIVDVLMRGLLFRGDGKHGIANFKYCHHHFKSPFELLGYELFNNKDRVLLGKDSYTMKEVRAILQAHGLTESGWFDRDLGELDLGGEKITTESEDSESTLSDEEFEMMIARSSRNLDERDFNKELKRRFGQLCDQFGIDYSRISPYDSDMGDVVYDYSNQPVRNALFRGLMADLLMGLKSLAELLKSNEEAVEDIKPLQNQVDETLEFITDFMNSDRNKQGEECWDNASWIEIVPKEDQGYKFILTVCPIDIGPYLSAALRKIQEQGCTVVFTSATITTDNKFDKFLYDIGLKHEEVKQSIVPSPFDYTNHACLFTSPSFPEPNVKGRMEKALKMLSSVIDATDGGIFILTTSYSALNEAYEYMSAHYSNKRRILKQGSNMTVSDTMQAFIKAGNAVLIGTSSFWEGVDVPGKALSLVIIDKMPFTQVGDPITKAIEGKLKSKGLNVFKCESLPNAIIALRQGAGRLIRNEADTGALVLLDPRLHTKNYGQTVFNSLPPMTHVTSVTEVLSFLKKVKS
ncbi:ATP-dependent DNA helicase [Anaerobiospirillum succiniciproducens]|uniref:ATP-dependent DNA helicase n=1 Tax=Anaerobiospirillum succiniciproducens TaxID=13335 RepID=UPI002943AABD|nr:ATP-dependent DNA helicase [Anaerobiospirillum succiniciproducens]